MWSVNWVINNPSRSICHFNCVAVDALDLCFAFHKLGLGFGVVKQNAKAHTSLTEDERSSGESEVKS